MIVRVVLWSLADSKTTVGELRRYLRDEAADKEARTSGLRLKLWLSDEATERLGAIELGESWDAAEQAEPGRERGLIGKDPEIGEELDLEASIEGDFAIEELSRLGLAFDE